jgi:tetratricopeptide (TPR) repeat protein
MREGMDAMARQPTVDPLNRASQLWQLPLLLVSLGLFAYAAYLFIDPRPGLSIDQKIDLGRLYLRNERADAALDQLNKILATEKLDRSHEADVHLLLGQAIDAAQRERHIDLPANRQQILEQTRQALAMGAKDTPLLERRLGESYEALDQPAEALDHYRAAMAMDADHALHLQRKVIDLQLAQNDAGPAAASLEEYLRDPSLSDSERSWALCEQAKLLVDQKQFVKARSLLDQALQLASDPSTQGQVNYYRGYCAYKLGDPAEAERLLRVARDQMTVQHPLDAEAAVLLGRICEDRQDPRTAESFYQDVLLSHPEARAATMALLGRASTRVAQGQDDSGLADFRDLTRELGAKESRKVYVPSAIEGLESSSAAMSARGDFAGALELLADEQQLDPQPGAMFYDRLAQIYEQRADQVEQSIDQAETAAERVRRDRQVRDFRTRAGDGYIAYAHGLTLADDKGYGEALWKGIDLYDRAANIQCVISALELCVAERPEDPTAPEALLRLGRAYQAAGLFDKAIAAFQRNQFRYPNSLAASKSAVPLAQAYIAKGSAYYGKAESVLKSVLENNPLLTPEAEEFKQALIELANLYYRTGRYEEAVARLDELTARYPRDERLGQLLFLMGDSYRKSAQLLAGKTTSLASASDGNGSAGGDARAAAVDLAEAAAARHDRLNRAKGLYDRVVDWYRTNPPSSDTDKLYNKLSHFYRADCLYDLGQYEEAIHLYDAAAFRYQDDPASLAAYVQIVNAYDALGKPDEAKAANERAKWLLKRMPEDAFNNGTFAMPKEYWEDQLKWAGQSGMW